MKEQINDIKNYFRLTYICDYPVGIYQRFIYENPKVILICDFVVDKSNLDMYLVWYNLYFNVNRMGYCLK